MEEYFDLLDENGNYLGVTKPRTEVHRDGDWHKAVHIWIFNKKGEVLLQRRASNKDSFPNMLDVSSAGHLSAGDKSLDGAIRELEEELGIKVDAKDLILFAQRKVDRFVSKTFINREFNDLYYLIADLKIEDMKIQEEELSEILFVTIDKLEELIKSGEAVIDEEEFKLVRKMRK